MMNRMEKMIFIRKKALPQKGHNSAWCLLKGISLLVIFEQDTVDHD